MEDGEKKEEEEEEKDIDEEKDVPEEAMKKLEESFMKIKEPRKFEVKPNMINADYCMKRLMRNVQEPEDFDSD